MTPRFFMSYILVNIFRILANLFETLIPFFRKTSAIATATLGSITVDVLEVFWRLFHPPFRSSKLSLNGPKAVLTMNALL
jgi:hypothetical protein